MACLSGAGIENNDIAFMNKGLEPLYDKGIKIKLVQVKLIGDHLCIRTDLPAFLCQFTERLAIPGNSNNLVVLVRASTLTISDPMPREAPVMIMFITFTFRALKINKIRVWIGYKLKLH